MEEVARHFAVAARTVDRWVKDGCPRDPRGWFELSAVGRWREARERARSAREKAPLASAEARWRMARAQAEEIRLAQLRGTLLDREDVERGRVARLVAVRRRLLALPRSAAPILAGLTPREIEAWLDGWARDAIRAFAEEVQPEDAGGPGSDEASPARASTTLAGEYDDPNDLAEPAVDLPGPQARAATA